jgi:rare lipoprotein A (peptidoglycan hydrolase)
MSLHTWFYNTLSAALLCTSFFGCNSNTTEDQDSETPKQSESVAPTNRKEVGEASWYGPGFHGRETASGETFDQKAMTAAHPSLPLGSKAKVTNLENGKSVEVIINDRGPDTKDRAIDLSGGAANKLDMKEQGTAQVKIESPRKQVKGHAEN